MQTCRQTDVMGKRDFNCLAQLQQLYYHAAWLLYVSQAHVYQTLVSTSRAQTTGVVGSACSSPN